MAPFSGAAPIWAVWIPPRYEKKSSQLPKYKRLLSLRVTRCLPCRWQWYCFEACSEGARSSLGGFQTSGWCPQRPLPPRVMGGPPAPQPVGCILGGGRGAAPGGSGSGVYTYLVVPERPGPWLRVPEPPFPESTGSNKRVHWGCSSGRDSLRAAALIGL